MPIEMSCAARPWVISDTMRFDSAGCAFERCDIEIAGGRIAAIVPAGSSALADGIDGASLICTPGVVDIAPPDGRIHPSWAAVAEPPACVTTMARHCTGDAPLEAGAAAAAMRRVALLRVDDRRPEQADAWPGWMPAAPATSAAPAGAAAPDVPSLVTALPVIASGDLASAAEIVAWAHRAKCAGTRIGIQFSAHSDVAHEFRARFCCSEAALIAYLMADDKRVTVFGAAPLDGRDIAALARTRSHAVIDACRDGERVRGRSAYAPLLEKGRAALRFRGGAALHRLMRETERASAALLDRCALALTRSAAAALGLDDVGAIAPGMKADLCLFERQAGDDLRGGGATLLSLLATRAPRAVLVDGRSRVCAKAALAATGAAH
ncbi:hypothetical protein BTI_1812 [Burkholderia thailandensis MSMB121]|uniref:amidohydrolase family protein n=1 Tax=Burkholderia humptydooensis TaxID=430531 RepID=UPI0003280341|nr:amidohydrolase family protein [Burkholderia humptydooensis]AGK47128.1 hypothetical protein BTI_1812 [Burkholderia thailandensis MSMB121]ATF36870.1 hypothetical protein CO709_28855 [Burkholderia thailandensis]KST74246.1 hypothetical protein WS76_08800 [Burkholderia humptydooensis]